MNSILTFIDTYDMARVSLSKCTKVLQIICILLLLSIYITQRRKLLQTIGRDKIVSKKSVLNDCSITKSNQNQSGEDGLETLLSDADKKVYRKEISKGYKDFAFNEFLSQSVAVGINNSFS